MITLPITVTRDGWPYEIFAMAEHTKRDGSKTILLRWRAQCVVCFDTFEGASGIFPKDAPAKKCPAHRGRS